MAESYVTTLILLDENKILTDLNSIAIELGLINNVFETLASLFFKNGFNSWSRRASSVVVSISTLLIY